VFLFLTHQKRAFKKSPFVFTFYLEKKNKCIEGNTNTVFDDSFSRADKWLEEGGFTNWVGDYPHGICYIQNVNTPSNYVEVW
jgi:hypothetical protein